MYFNLLMQKYAHLIFIHLIHKDDDLNNIIIYKYNNVK